MTTNYNRKCPNQLHANSNNRYLFTPSEQQVLEWQMPRDGENAGERNSFSGEQSDKTELGVYRWAQSPLSITDLTEILALVREGMYNSIHPGITRCPREAVGECCVLITDDRP